jgi:hypothetical protein
LCPGNPEVISLPPPFGTTVSNTVADFTAAA